MMPPANQEAIARYILHTDEDFDNIELRTIREREVRKYWTTAIEFAVLLDELDTLNRQGWNIYIGVNPRKERGKSGDKEVLLARCLFADFDGLAGDAAAMISEVMKRIEGAKLPDPTMLIFSGHGLHCYWRLVEPIPDLAAWTLYQKGLIRVLNSDKAIHNPERIMRVPGFTNWKAEPVDCYIVDIKDSIYAS
jgi:hypothetical protein